MDWFVDAADAGALGALRRSAADYLRRHAWPGSDLGGAELAVSEIVANVHRHASGPCWVSVDWSGESPVLSVVDLGPGFDLDGVELPDVSAEGGRGLYIVSHLTEQLSVARRRGGGAIVEAVLPVRRSVEESHDPLRSTFAALPAAEESGAEGAFGKEAFLRALVVQLAQHVEREHGPEAAERAVAQVGTDVGGRMEDEYRRARGLVERLSAEEMADLYVRLKHAIDGDFYVLEASDDVIRLGNRRCPFGDVVTRAPQLCRMTSSVFGGIAARNTDGGVVVQLEERIAVGDPGCVVTVWLRVPPEGRAYGHAYRAAGV